MQPVAWCYFAENSDFGVDIHIGAKATIVSSEIIKYEQVQYCIV